ncbi:hypothetical protein QUA04_27930 [Microcoleus sp. S13_C5]
MDECWVLSPNAAYGKAAMPSAGFPNALQRPIFDRESGNLPKVSLVASQGKRISNAIDKGI